MGDMTKCFVAHQATVPFTFRFQVSHWTQRSLYNPSQLSRVYDRAPRGAVVPFGGHDVVESAFAGDVLGGVSLGVSGVQGDYYPPVFLVRDVVEEFFDLGGLFRAVGD